MSLAITIACFLVLIAGLFAVIVERTTERDDARDERDTARAESVAILAQAELLADELSHADKTIRNLAAQVASNVIPLPRQSDDDPYTWPALAREIEHDDLTKIMRAVESETGGAS